MPALRHDIVPCSSLTDGRCGSPASLAPYGLKQRGQEPIAGCVVLKTVPTSPFSTLHTVPHGPTPPSVRTRCPNRRPSGARELAYTPSLDESIRDDLCYLVGVGHVGDLLADARGGGSDLRVR